MHARFAAEGKRGVTMRSGATYSTWWNGGLRTTVYFHNQIGLLTETIGSPTPIEIPFVRERQRPSADLPLPIAPQQWHFRQSIDYSITANRAVLDVASRYRETLLFNIYRMGMNSIERGSRDSWTPYPHRPVTRTPDPAQRDARGYILPSDQPDFLTATKFVNTLIRNGIDVHRATAAFSVGGKSVSGGLVRREGGTGVPPARARHVRAAGLIPTTSRTPGRRPRRRTTAPAGRWRCRWAWASIACSKASTVRSRS